MKLIVKAHPVGDGIEIELPPGVQQAPYSIHVIDGKAVCYVAYPEFTEQEKRDMMYQQQLAQGRGVPPGGIIA